MEILPEPDILLDPPELPEIPLPKGWTEYTLLAVLHVIALARIIVLNVANWPSGRECDGLRLHVENDRLHGEIEMLKIEIAIKDARFSRLEPKKRPHYLPEERLEILALRAMRGWNNTQVTERVILTYKDGCTRRILAPISRAEMIKETQLFFEWYNEHRPHMTLRGKTPNEVYFDHHAANVKPRIETRPLARHKTPCASPRMCIAGKAGAKVRVRLEFLEGRLHLPVLKVERV